MKYAIVIPDGCADEPRSELNGLTPLEAAKTPAMDRIASAGVVGRANNVPAHMNPGSEVANMSLLGYDPNKFFTGRAPLEVAAQGIELGANDWAIRCNLVTIEDQVMRDFTAGHISTVEARELLGALQQSMPAHLEFHAGVSYRNALIFRGDQVSPPFTRETTGSPPHDLTDKSVADDYPRGSGSDLLCDLMSQSVEVFAAHPVNQRRVAAGKLPATNIWLWGLGKSPKLPSFFDRHGLQGAMITAVDLLRGLAALVGWRREDVEGATGYLDTDYAAKGRRAVELLDEVDVVCVHIEAPDEASHEGRADAKIEALEQIDRHIVAPLHAALATHGDYRILVTPDHPTFLRTKTHSHGYVPWTVCGTGIAADASTQYGESSARASSIVFDKGFRLMEYFLNATVAD
ncbi:MAG: cofactor-independent phosphoglycerate mutase [Pirellulaceae bacterium]